eukprot:GILK01002943.1.p1 GENE.GILK01002943.1~~GILK01002943.1.p1  ORF type:complete len:101 (+),score=0.99 GILK01002943.1:84-386(+)
MLNGKSSNRGSKGHTAQNEKPSTNLMDPRVSSPQPVALHMVKSQQQAASIYWHPRKTPVARISWLTRPSAQHEACSQGTASPTSSSSIITDSPSVHVSLL